MRGFTLIELLVTLAIAGILAVLAGQSYAGHVLRMRRVEARVALADAMLQQERQFPQNGGYSAFSADADAGFRWWSGAAPRSSRYELSAAPCEGQTLRTCVKLVATPGTARVDGRFRDPECGALSLTSTGVREPAEPARCWQ